MHPAAGDGPTIARMVASESSSTTVRSSSKPLPVDSSRPAPRAAARGFHARGGQQIEQAAGALLSLAARLLREPPPRPGGAIVIKRSNQELVGILRGAKKERAMRSPHLARADSSSAMAARRRAAPRRGRLATPECAM